MENCGLQAGSELSPVTEQDGLEVTKTNSTDWRHSSLRSATPIGTHYTRPAYTLWRFLSEHVSLPLIEIMRQIDLGYAKVNGETCRNAEYGVIPGCEIRLGHTKQWEV